MQVRGLSMRRTGRTPEDPVHGLEDFFRPKAVRVSQIEHLQLFCKCAWCMSWFISSLAGNVPALLGMSGGHAAAVTCGKSFEDQSDLKLIAPLVASLWEGMLPDLDRRSWRLVTEVALTWLLRESLGLYVTGTMVYKPFTVTTGPNFCEHHSCLIPHQGQACPIQRL